MKKYKLQKGTYIGALYTDFYTDKNKNRKKMLHGYILLGIFNGEGVGMEIKLWELPPEKNDFGKKMFIIKSGRRQIGFFFQEEGSSSSGKSYHFLKGKVNIGGLDIRINAYLNRKSIKKKLDDNGEPIPDYIIELAQFVNCGILKLS